MASPPPPPPQCFVSSEPSDTPVSNITPVGGKINPLLNNPFPLFPIHYHRSAHHYTMGNANQARAASRTTPHPASEKTQLVLATPRESARGSEQNTSKPAEDEKKGLLTPCHSPQKFAVDINVSISVLCKYKYKKDGYYNCQYYEEKKYYIDVVIPFKSWWPAIKG